MVTVIIASMDTAEGNGVVRMNVKVKNEFSGRREYLYENETGDAQIVVYELFPGVEVAYASVHMDRFDFTETEGTFRERYVGFHYCREGRIEQEEDNEFFYLMPGDCSVVIQDKKVKQYSLPLKHYHGISIGIDMDSAPEVFSAYLGNEAITPLLVAKLLCGEKTSTILRSVDQLKHIFTESYAVDESLRMDYLKVKLLELLVVLSQIARSGAELTEVSVPRTQAELVKQAAAYISENINAKLTLKALSTRFHVSETYLQNSFRAVYGMPVISFIRAQKMQSAAQALIHTTRSVDEIAEEFGYINESKFSAAFKKIMGDSPSTYRREHSKIKIL